MKTKHVMNVNIGDTIEFRTRSGWVFERVMCVIQRIEPGCGSVTVNGVTVDFDRKIILTGSTQKYVIMGNGRGWVKEMVRVR